MEQQLLTALQQLDPSNDDHWTGEGLPRVDVVRALAGAGTLTREQLTALAPGFTRDTAGPAAAAQAAIDPVVSTVTAGNGEDPATADGAAGNDGMPADVGVALASTELQALHNELALAQKVLNEAKQAVAAIEAKIDAVLRASGGAYVYDTPTQAVGSYLQQQLAERAARAARISALNVTPEGLASARELLGSLQPSKLDSALAARKRGG